MIHTPCATEERFRANSRLDPCVDRRRRVVDRGRRLQQRIGRESLADRCASGFRLAVEWVVVRPGAGDNDIAALRPQPTELLPLEAARMSLTRHNLRDYGTRRSLQSFLSVSNRWRWRNVSVIGKTLILMQDVGREETREAKPRITGNVMYRAPRGQQRHDEANKHDFRETTYADPGGLVPLCRHLRRGQGFFTGRPGRNHRNCH